MKQAFEPLQKKVHQNCVVDIYEQTLRLIALLILLSSFAFK
jgi:hypothetical protein